MGVNSCLGTAPVLGSVLCVSPVWVARCLADESSYLMCVSSCLVGVDSVSSSLVGAASVSKCLVGVGRVVRALVSVNS